MKNLLSWGVAFGCLGCADAFEVRRQELGGFRIAALGLVDGTADAAIWSGEGMGHDQAPLLEWSLDGESIGEGWEIQPEGEGLLELRATSGAGEVALATVSIGTAPVMPDVDRHAVEVGTDISIEARSALQEESVESGVAAGQALRLHVDADSSLRAHFMVAGSLGTILELDALTADFLAEEIVFNDTEIESREAVDCGLFHLLILVQDLHGGNRWLWLDAPMGVSEGWVPSGERRLDLDVDRSTGMVEVELARIDGFEMWSLENPVPVQDLTGQTELACAPVEQPFQLDWITNGRCGLDEIEGARLVVEVQ